MGEYFFVNRIVDTVPDRKTCSKYCLFKFLCARLFVMIMYQVLYSVYAFPNVWNYTEQNNIQLNILLMKTHKKQNQEFIWIFYIFNMYPPPPKNPWNYPPNLLILHRHDRPRHLKQLLVKLTQRKKVEERRKWKF